MKVSGSRPLWIALASLALTPLSWSASADEAGFSATANRTCRQIIETRPDRVLGKGRKAGVEVILAGRAGAELSRDARHALRNDLAASRDELRRSVRALEGFAPPDGQQEDWNIFTAFLEAEMARQDNRLQWLEDPTSTLIPASEFGPPVRVVDDAMERLGFAGRDCELIAQDVEIPEDRADFVSRAAAVCSDIVARQSRQDHEGNRDIALAALLDAHHGTLVLPAPELDAALSAIEAEWRLSLAQLSDIPADLAPEDETWTGFLQAFRQMAEIQQSRLLVLRAADADPSAAYKAIRSPVIDVDLAALGLENTDCRSIRF